MPNYFSDLSYAYPYLIVGLGILIATTIEMFSSKSEKILPALTIAALLTAALFELPALEQNRDIFNNLLSVGGLSSLFNVLFMVAAIITTLSSIDYIKKYGAYFGEFYIILLSAVLGMMMMAGSLDLFTVFLGLELMSIPFYILAGINRNKSFSNEASLKYFLLGAFATGFIVFGIALIFGAAHTTSIIEIVSRFSALAENFIFIGGVLLLLIGFSFKIAAFPFHMWAPDVYQGSPTTVAGFMSTAGKAAAFSVILIMVAAIMLHGESNIFRPYFIAISIFSMLFGAIVAISQSNLKRMLAYSSVSHAGYMIIGLAAGNSFGYSGIVFYLIAYAFMNLGAFGLISIIESENDGNVDVDSYAGLNSRKPAYAALMALFMFALSGIPPFAGFFGKYYIFISAIQADLTWLAIIGVLSSVISVYFYLKVVVYMYFRDPSGELTFENSLGGMFAIGIAITLVIIIGVFPNSLISLISSLVANLI